MSMIWPSAGVFFSGLKSFSNVLNREAFIFVNGEEADILSCYFCND
jgi:hypothetical protein